MFRKKIEPLFLGFSQFSIEDALPKKFYKKDKNSFDICFVAARYSKNGIDKGYDLFVEAAQRLAPYYPDMRFHVVGDWDELEIDVSDIKDKITFYGLQQPPFLKELYSKMDICLSPCRPYQLYEGNFDGFPLGFECMFLQTALFTTDELNNNNGYFDADELVVIKPDIEDIVLKIEYYYYNLNKLYFISKKGQDRINVLLNPIEKLHQITKILTGLVQSGGYNKSSTTR